jgi:hypothetical protein
VAAVDEGEQVIDVYVLPRRDRSDDRPFFDDGLVTAVMAPVEVVADQARS